MDTLLSINDVFAALCTWHVDCIILHCSKCFENVKHRSDEDKAKYQLGDY